MKKFLFSLSATLLLILGCKKDDDEEKDPTAVNIENVSGNYKLIDYSIRVGSITLSYIDSLPNCFKDNIMILKSDKTYTWNDTGEQCSGSSGGDDSGNWDLSGTTKFVWDGDDYDIDRFDGKVLEFSYSETDPQSGQKVSEIYEFQKQ